MKWYHDYLLELTGGSTKGGGTAGGALEAVRLHRPKAIICTSVGAILALPVALSMDKKYTHLRGDILYHTANVNMKDMFPKWPALTAGGWPHPKAAIRAITGKNSLGLQDTTHYVKNFVSQGDFDYYKATKELPTIYVSVTNYQTGKLEYVNLKALNYEEALLYIEASARMMVFAQPVIIDGVAYYDGGTIDKSGSDLAKGILELHNISNVVSIYHHEQEMPAAKQAVPTNIKQAAGRMLEIWMHYKDVNDQKLMTNTCDDLGIKHHKIYIDNYMQSFYDTDKKRLLKMQVEAAKKMNNFIETH